MMSYLKRTTDFLQKRRILQHIIFWVAVLFYAISRKLIDEESNLSLSIAKNVCILLAQMMASYFTAYFIIDKLLAQKKYLISSILIVVSTYFFAAIGRVLNVHVAEPLYREPPFVQETFFEIFTDIKHLFLFYSPSIYYTVFIFLFVKYFLSYKLAKENELKHNTEKVASELKTLKAQLNPHFLFNTLNNIYVLSLENSPQTPKSIEKLSSILDHVLYRCNSKFVSLESEINLLENYIDLEKLRYDERLQITFNTSIEKKGEIAPLILLSLVENAFKHGAGEDSGSPKIDISIYNSSNEFKFIISNTVAIQQDISNREAIGLKNIKKQLELIYANQFSLEVDTSNSIFTVTLIINN